MKDRTFKPSNLGGLGEGGSWDALGSRTSNRFLGTHPLDCRTLSNTLCNLFNFVAGLQFSKVDIPYVPGNEMLTFIHKLAFWDDVFLLDSWNRQRFPFANSIGWSRM